MRSAIKTLQPVFRNSNGDVATAEMLGRLNPKGEFQQVVADPGYAVSGIEAVGGSRVRALKVSFRQTDAKPTFADDKDSYESP